MTPKEALDWVENVFEEHHVQLPDVELTLLREALTELEELKRYPTADEVCKALSKFWGNQVRYDERHSLFEMYVGDNTWKPVELLRMRTVKPSLITLIGRFYEGLEKGEVK